MNNSAARASSDRVCLPITGVKSAAGYNAGDGSAFARLIATISLRDDVLLEASSGIFAGRGADVRLRSDAAARASAGHVLAQLADRDFFYARLKVFF